MSLGATLLRLLLCLSLSGNAVATAATSVQMAVTQAAAAAGSKATPALAPPCHEHAGMAGMEQAHPATATATHPCPDPPSPEVPDCCKSGLCDCACMQTLPVSVALLVLPDAMIAHASAVGAIAKAHPSPMLAHPIRPPIGQA